jgi:DNA-binding transcriptional MerR regulator
MRTAAAASALPLDDFANLVGQNADVLAALSGSATQGAEFIAGMGNALRTQAVPQLATLGFTVEEINDTLLLNLERQRRTGMFDAQATQFNIDSAIRFGQQLDRLAKLTGVQREQLQKEIEAAQSNERFQAFLQGTTEETRQRLDLFAGTISSLAPGLTEGFQDLIANAGRPVTDSAIALIQNIPEAQGVVQQLINGSISTETALSKIRDASTKSIDRFRSATVTGQVEFLALQNDVINLGRRLVDVQAILGENKVLRQKV